MRSAIPIILYNNSDLQQVAYLTTLIVYVVSSDRKIVGLVKWELYGRKRSWVILM
jgi:hypothetical protein